ncbi:MAG TPA: hypothetical protein VFT96_11230, partial [Gemmatimonadaceae bacterium]|nr:hypothetical protein [Gemmatimonadaceae bacterium]
AADAAVAQILSLAGVGRDGPRLAELETSSTAAFEQYIRAARASADGRASSEIAALDAAIALDSSFGSALLLRAGIAREHGDTALLRRLTTRLARVRPRLSERDRLHWDASQALHAGDRTRAERLARELVVRFPRDPRGHDMLADLYFVTGRWREMEQLLRETLALDSLGMSAGDGPCVPCVTYGRLVEVQWRRGDREGAERTARRWVEVQPASANAHHHLAKVLARLRRGAEAERHMLRAVSLSGGDPGQQVALARVYLMTRNLDAVDSLLRAWDRSGSPAYDAARPDIRSLLTLERGDLRPGVIALQRALAADPRMRWLELVLGTLHGRMGDYRSATTLLESHGHLQPGPVKLPLDATAARNFAWSHALLADAIAPSGDTVRLRALADSIALVAPSSYFGRDWTLHHHVRGLIAMHGRRYAEAEREFQRARWGAAGWTRTVVELAKAQLAQGRARDAMVTLRDAYEWPDAMGRYQAVRETDSLMAEARRRIPAHQQIPLGALPSGDSVRLNRLLLQ